MAAASGTLTLTFDSSEQCDAVEAALRPELGEEVPGSRVVLERDGATLTLRIAAEDAGALRAAVNSYLRWSRTAVDVHRLTLDPPGKPSNP